MMRLGKFLDLVMRPNRTMAMLATAPRLDESGRVVCALMVVSFFVAVFEALVRFAEVGLLVAGVDAQGNFIMVPGITEFHPEWLWLPVGVPSGICAAWLVLTALLHLIARTLGGRGRYRDLLALMGYASAPMVLTALVSIVLYIVNSFISQAPTPTWWFGLSWGWLGLLSYYALRHGEQLSSGKAAGVVVLTYILLPLGWLLLTHMVL